MVMIICTDEFYSRAGELVSWEPHHWKTVERKKVFRNNFDNVFPPLFWWILLRNLSSAFLPPRSIADQKMG